MKGNWARRDSPWEVVKSCPLPSTKHGQKLFSFSGSTRLSDNTAEFEEHDQLGRLSKVNRNADRGINIAVGTVLANDIAEFGENGWLSMLSSFGASSGQKEFALTCSTAYLHR